MRRIFCLLSGLVTALLLNATLTHPAAAQLVEAAGKVEPSIVTVTTRYEVKSELGTRTYHESQLTGTIVSTDGLVVTVKYHRRPAEHTVTLPDGRTVKAKELVIDRRNYLALLQIDAPELTAFKPTYAEPAVGQSAVTVYANTSRQGFVIASGKIGEYLFPRGLAAIGHATTIPAPLLAGGSPVFNKEGALIGSTHQIRRPKDREIGAIIIVPGEFIRQLIAAQPEDGQLVEIKPGMMGMQMSNVEGESAATVTKVVENSAAATAGIVAGDRITHFLGKAITRGADVVFAGRRLRAGDTAEVRYVRNDENRTANLTLLEVPEDLFKPGPEQQKPPQPVETNEPDDTKTKPRRPEKQDPP